MGVSHYPWFRLYTEFAHDPKVQMLAFEDQRHFIVLLCLKCNGTLDTSAVSDSHKDRLIYKSLGLDATTGSEVKRRLMEVNLIDSGWQPTKWDARQSKSDHSNGRVKKHREKQRLNNEKQECNVTVTDKIRIDKNRIEEEEREREGAQQVAAPPTRTRSRSGNGSRISDDFALTSERIAVAVAEKIDPQRTFAGFMDYWQSASGARARKVDWDAVWRNWCRRQSDMNAQQRGNKKQSTSVDGTARINPNYNPADFEGMQWT